MASPNPNATALGKPYPTYLIPQVARILIGALKDAGVEVRITAPAPGSVAVTARSPGEKGCFEMGRPDDLEMLLRKVCDRCGVELSDT